jgi:hypothetical protein
MAQPRVDARYAINEASIVSDVLDGEVVLVNLDTGAYYILESTASVIWQMLAANHSPSEIADTLTRHYTGDAATIASSVADFVAQLLQEALLVPAVPEVSEGAPITPAGLADDGRAFAAPAMYRYTDMQALIQMDPIREYDETGWPRRPTRPPAPTE